MNDWPAITLLFVLVAIVGGLVWSVWRHRVVEDLHAIRERLEARAHWEQEIVESLHDLVKVARDIERANDERA